MSNLLDTSAALRLPLCFDSGRLKADLALIQSEEWTPHYNEFDYGGKWSGVALRSVSGSAGQLVALAPDQYDQSDQSGYRDTALIQRCLNLAEVLATFQCPLKSVRLLSLSSGSLIREHRDPDFGCAEKEIRLHVPVRTNPGVEFYLEGRRLLLEEGNCYYIDAGRPHSVVNRGPDDRIHLVIDVEVNKWVVDLLDAGQSVESLAPAAAGFESFRNTVFADTELQQALSAIHDPLEFADAVARAGRARGFDFGPSEVLRTSVAKTDAFAPCRTASGRWLPVSIGFRQSKPFAKWVHFSGRLTEPFFETSVRNALRLPFARAFQREGPLAFRETFREPSGFIFHMSRCGSTLMGQMLAAPDRSLVISEAPAIDDVLQADLQVPSLSEDEQIQWLRSVIAALGQPNGTGDLYFVKLDSWHIHKLPLIRRAFPSTPWIFLYRNPLEVLVSQLRHPGKFSLPGAMATAILDMRFEDILDLSRDEWCARVLAGFCRSALRFRDERQALFLNYNQLPAVVWTTVAAHFATSFTDREVAQMEAATRFDTKNPSRPFLPDSEQKSREAQPAVRDLTARLLSPLYLELESVRRPS